MSGPVPIVLFFVPDERRIENDKRKKIYIEKISLLIPMLKLYKRKKNVNYLTSYAYYRQNLLLSADGVQND